MYCRDGSKVMLFLGTYVEQYLCLYRIDCSFMLVCILLEVPLDTLRCCSPWSSCGWEMSCLPLVVCISVSLCGMEYIKGVFLSITCCGTGMHASCHAREGSLESTGSGNVDCYWASGSWGR